MKLQENRNLLFFLVYLCFLILNLVNNTESCVIPLPGLLIYYYPSILSVLKLFQILLPCHNFLYMTEIIYFLAHLPDIYSYFLLRAITPFTFRALKLER